MTTDIDRLRAWMGHTGIDSKSLSSAMLYTRDLVEPVLAESRLIRDGFAWRFAGAFGEEAHNKVFGESLAGRAARCGVDAWYHIAHLSVTSAIQCGLLPHAKTHKCAGCDTRANLFHHESYHPTNMLCVVPLCISCHMLHHNGSKRLPLGIVPTRVGLVRIAISRSPN